MRCFHYEYFVLNINTENAKAERGKAGSMVRRLAWKVDYQSTGSLNGSFPFVNYKVELFPAQRDLSPRRGEVSQVDEEEAFMLIVWILGTTPM